MNKKDFNSEIQVQYCITKALPPEQVEELYRAEGWIEPDSNADFIQPMLQNSYAVSAAFYEGRLLGMMRALSDGVSDAYLLDLVVHKDFRKHGIATEILNRLKAHLQEKGIDWIVCIGVPGTEDFYHKRSGATMTGFTPIRFKN